MGQPPPMAIVAVQIQISDVAKVSPACWRLAGLTWGELELTLGH